MISEGEKTGNGDFSSPFPLNLLTDSLMIGITIYRLFRHHLFQD